MSTKTNLPPVPPALADVALIDGPTCAAAGGMSLSSFHEVVREGSAPQPVVRQPRFTRWRLADIRKWLIERGSIQTPGQADEVTARARKASAKAREPKAVAKAQATQRARIAARADKAGA